MLSSPIPRDCISNRRSFSARSVVGSSPPAQAKLSRATRIGKIRPWRKASSNERRSRSIHADRKSTRLNSSHGYISYAVFCLKKKKKNIVSVDDEGRHEK